MFDTQPNGDLMMTFAGGHQIRRTHSCKNLSGMEFMRVLRDEFVNQRIDSIEFSPVVELLITETMWALGAHMVNNNGERFIHELETRDTEAAALIREVRGRGNGIPTPNNTYGIWLDTPMINILTGIPDKVATHFAGIVHRFNLYGIDVNAEPILIYPTRHYQNGGVEIDPDGRTAIEGLCAAGEVSGGVQGLNRLGSNSMTDIFVFGQRSARHAIDYIRKTPAGTLPLRHVADYNKQLDEIGPRGDISSPLLFPDYTREEVRQRSLGR